MSMLNNLRSDVYRLCKGKSLYVSMGILCVLFYFMQLSGGVSSHTPLASYNATSGSLLDFMYYFPKSMFFTLAVTIILALFRGEEFSSGYIKNIYTKYESRTTLLLSRLVMNILVWLILWSVVTLMIVLMNLCMLHDPALSTINIFDYGMYCIVQMLILSAAIAFIDFTIYLFRNKTFAVVIAIAYASSLIYMLLSLLNMYLPNEMDFLSFTLTQASGTLPMQFDIAIHGKAFLLALSSFILYTIGSHILLKKKDLL